MTPHRRRNRWERRVIQRARERSYRALVSMTGNRGRLPSRWFKIYKTKDGPRVVLRAATERP